MGKLGGWEALTLRLVLGENPKKINWPLGRFMKRRKVAIAIDEILSAEERPQQLKLVKLATELAKLDPAEERSLAEEGITRNGLHTRKEHYKPIQCVSCGFKEMVRVVNRTEVITYGGEFVTLTGLSGWFCPSCNDGWYDDDDQARYAKAGDDLIHHARKLQN
jgi:YgiT-type zinc finger domain-containing protein